MVTYKLIKLIIIIKKIIQESSNVHCGFSTKSLSLVINEIIYALNKLKVSF